MSEIGQKYAPQQQSGFFSLPNLGVQYQVRIVSELYAIQKAPSKNKQTGQIYPSRTVFLCRIIDRADKEVKLWEMPTTVKNQMLTYSQDADYAYDDMPGYDIKITKSKENNFTKYTVIAGRPLPLTPVEEEEIRTEKAIEEVGSIIQNKETEKMNAFAMVPSDNPTHEITVDEIPF